ncbi:hypothetical protein J1614_011082 [Plenodomus biglobosus]|nr:hypothetical protein J1614_011082 [Plenodomus biglobosus]
MSLYKMRRDPLSNTSEIYAIACNRFASSWFYAVNSPIKFHLIPPSLYIDRVNALLKLYNHKKEGVFTINKKRALKHVAGWNRTIKAAQHEDTHLVYSVMPT